MVRITRTKEEKFDLDGNLSKQITQTTIDVNVEDFREIMHSLNESPMDKILNRLSEMRRDYPFVGYIVILFLFASLILGFLEASEGKWIPVIVAFIVSFFLLFLLLVFRNVSSPSTEGGFPPLLAIAVQSIIFCIFLYFLIILIQAAQGNIELFGYSFSSKQDP